MGRILSTDVIDKIASVDVDALPNLWQAALNSPDAGIFSAMQEEWGTRASGSSAAVVQQLGVLIDEGVGWAPWQGGALVSLASLPTESLLSGRALTDRLVDLAINLASLAWPAFQDLVVGAVVDLLEPILNLITAVPVIGQIIQLALGFVIELVKLIKKHNTQTDQAAEEAIEAQRILPAVPDPHADKALLDSYIKRTANALGDWSPVFMPYLDFEDGQGYIQRFGWWGKHEGGWVCPPIKQKLVSNPYAGGVRIAPAGSSSWGVVANQINKGFGLGFVPGPTANIHRDIQIAPGGKPVDTGEWLTMSRNAAMFLWSLLWSDGPSAFTVDPDLVTDAWARYIYAFLRALDDGKMCRKDGVTFAGISQATRSAVRVHFCKTVGIKNIDPIPATLSFPGRPQMDILRTRQKGLLKTTTVAYVDPSKAPPGLRKQLEDARASLLESELLCRVDTSLIPDATFRMAVEGKLMWSGMKCKIGGVQLQAPVVGPDGLDIQAPLPTPLTPELPDVSTPYAPATSPRRRSMAPVLVGAAAVGGLFWLKNRAK